MMGPLGTRVTDRKELKSRHRIYVVLRMSVMMVWLCHEGRLGHVL